MLENFINAFIRTTILMIIIVPFVLIKNHMDKKNFVDEKKGEYAEYDNRFFEELKRKNEEYEKDSNNK